MEKERMKKTVSVNNEERKNEENSMCQQWRKKE